MYDSSIWKFVVSKIKVVSYQDSTSHPFQSTLPSPTTPYPQQVLAGALVERGGREEQKMNFYHEVNMYKMSIHP